TAAVRVRLWATSRHRRWVYRYHRPPRRTASGPNRNLRIAPMSPEILTCAKWRVEASVCFYHYRRLFFHAWIVTTFIITMVATPLRALATPEASACGYLAGLIDKAPQGPLFLPSYPTVESGPLHGAAYLYDNAVAAIALVGCGERDKARRIDAEILWAIDNDRTWHDGRLRNAY